MAKHETGLTWILLLRRRRGLSEVEGSFLCHVVGSDYAGDKLRLTAPDIRYMHNL